MSNFQEILEKKKKNLKKNQSSTQVDPEQEKLFKQRQIKSIHKNLVRKFDIPKRFQGKTFEDYNPYEQNKKGYETVKKYADTFEDRLENGDWLVLSGGYGLGKTHLALATAKKALWTFAEQYINKNPAAINRTDMADPILFKSSTQLIEDIRDCYDSELKNEQEVMSHFKNVRLLIVDDLGTEKASEWQHEKMYSILNYRYLQMLPTIITTNLGMAGLKKQVSERVVERMIEAAGEFLWEFKGKSYRRSNR